MPVKLCEKLFGPFICLALAVSCVKAQRLELIRPVKTIAVQSALGAISKSFPTKAKAAEDVNLSFDIPGTLQRIAVDVGTQVTKGQVVAMLDDRDYQQAFAAAQANYDNASALYNRVKTAAAANAVSQQELTSSKAQFDAAAAQLAVQRKALESTKLTAPFDGEVTQKFVTDFMNIGAGMPVVRIINPASIDLPVSLPESIIARKDTEIDHVTLTASFDAIPNREFPVAIKSISQEADLLTGVYPAVLTMPQPVDVRILPGMVGQISIHLKPDAQESPLASLHLVPLAAVFDEDGQSFVYVVNKESMQIEKKSVELSDTSVGGMAVEGLTDGDIVVAAGVSQLREGQKVRILNEGA